MVGLSTARIPGLLVAWTTGLTGEPPRRLSRSLSTSVEREMGRKRRHKMSDTITEKMLRDESTILNSSVKEAYLSCMNDKLLKDRTTEQEIRDGLLLFDVWLRCNHNAGCAVPTKSGYYWIQAYNRLTGLSDGEPQMVRVIFGYPMRNKKVTKVLTFHWSAKLEEVLEVYWSHEVLPPTFPQ